MKPFFTADDFEHSVTVGNIHGEMGQRDKEFYANLLNEKLQKLIESSPVVYEKPGYHIWSGDNINNAANSKARLMFIEPIEKKECEHSFVKQVHLRGNPPAWVPHGICPDCNIELVAVWKAKE